MPRRFFHLLFISITFLVPLPSRAYSDDDKLPVCPRCGRSDSYLCIPGGNFPAEIKSTTKAVTLTGSTSTRVLFGTRSPETRDPFPLLKSSFNELASRGRLFFEYRWGNEIITGSDPRLPNLVSLLNHLEGNRYISAFEIDESDRVLLDGKVFEIKPTYVDDNSRRGLSDQERLLIDLRLLSLVARNSQQVDLEDVSHLNGKKLYWKIAPSLKGKSPFFPIGYISGEKLMEQIKSLKPDEIKSLELVSERESPRAGVIGVWVYQTQSNNSLLSWEKWPASDYHQIRDRFERNRATLSALPPLSESLLKKCQALPN